MKTAEIVNFPTYETRMCKACNEVKSMNEFYFHKQNGTHTHKCLSCHQDQERKRQKALWANNPEYRSRHNQAGKNYRRGVRTEKLPPEVKGNEKVCKVCVTTKPMSEFPLRSKHRLNTCSVCYNEHENLKARTKYREDTFYRARIVEKNRRLSLKYKYGITPEAADKMLESQHGLCANRGCGKEITFSAKIGSGDLAVIDHCHKTNQVRGALCHSCNISLGHLEKDKNLILGLLEYAKKPTITGD